MPELYSEYDGLAEKRGDTFAYNERANIGLSVLIKLQLQIFLTHRNFLANLQFFLIIPLIRNGKIIDI